jgi:hypothetical protein
MFSNISLKDKKTDIKNQTHEKLVKPILAPSIY